MTTHMPTETNVVKRVGPFSGSSTTPFLAPQDGIYFENSAGTFSWNIAKNGTVTETIAQASWNLDKLDGTGISGITLNLSAAQILVIDYQWLGVGDVRVGFNINGINVYVHQFYHSNVPAFTSVYTQTPNLPLRYTIHNTAVTASVSGLGQICTSIISEAGDDGTASFSYNSGLTGLAIAVAPAINALFGFRLKTGYLGATIIPTNININSTSGAPVLMTLNLNPTISGAFTFSGVTNSALEAFTGTVSNTISGGTTLHSIYNEDLASSLLNLDNALRLGALIDGTRDVLVVTVSRSGGVSTAFGAFNWRETL
jgi:hypothetical protein